eukprot:m.248964 g.248964  ORF g.248964 m.248964 type:complete len:1003 (+) comp26476_c1_seq17:3-3011(+)
MVDVPSIHCRLDRSPAAKRGDRCMMSTWPRLPVVPLLAVLVVGGQDSEACQFHCGSPSTWCGAAYPVYVTHTFALPTVTEFGIPASLPSPTLHSLDLTFRNITRIADGGLSCFFVDAPGDSDDDGFSLGKTQAILLDHNQLTAIPDLTQFNFTTYISLKNNEITEMRPHVLDGWENRELVLYLDGNRIASVPTGAFAFKGEVLVVSLVDNEVTDVGEVFQGFVGVAEVVCDLQGNAVTADGLATAMQSYREGTALLTLIFRDNNITELPAQLFDGMGRDTPIGLSIIVDVSSNPISMLSTASFSGASLLQSVTILLSNTTAHSLAIPTTPFVYTGIEWDAANGGALRLFFGNTSVDMAIVRALSSGANLPETLEVNLMNNDFRYIPPGAFHGSRATAIDLSSNAITWVSPDAFDYTLDLRTLALSNNRLTVINAGLMSNVPALASLIFNDNLVWAVPLTSNHVGERTAANSNVLACAAFGPMLSGCACPRGLVFSTHCGYGRCLSTMDGCGVGLLFNNRSCAAAPSSTCIASCAVGQYYSAGLQECVAVTQCSTAFRQGSTTQFQKAYQFDDVTATSDRQCSICSTCPVGYDTVPCTAMVNAQCTKLSKLGAGDVAAIVMSTVLLMAAAAAGVLYGRLNFHRSKLTADELEMTELLLGNVSLEKERLTAENRRKQRAWVIDEADLKMAEVIGTGGMGVVRRALWGHIAVAVKTLKLPLDFDPLVSEEFHREVDFMSSIRHPNVIAFFGAGVYSDNRAFIVTELMARGSLRSLLDQPEVDLPWSTRVTFARDIAKGMEYLHAQDTVHRDLKADNCFASEDWRVKVADFGTGRLEVTAIEAATPTAATLNAPPAHKPRSASVESYDSGASRFLTVGLGSVLWMAPEVLFGRPIDPQHVTSTDVYSFGCILFEIWTRRYPWWHIEIDERFKFEAALKAAIASGGRPVPPEGSPAAAPAFAGLMPACWAANPAVRPTFTTILAQLEEAGGEAGVGIRSDNGRQHYE